MQNRTALFFSVISIFVLFSIQVHSVKIRPVIVRQIQCHWNNLHKNQKNMDLEAFIYELNDSDGIKYFIALGYGVFDKKCAACDEIDSINGLGHIKKAHPVTYGRIEHLFKEKLPFEIDYSLSKESEAENPCLLIKAIIGDFKKYAQGFSGFSMKKD